MIATALRYAISEALLRAQRRCHAAYAMLIFHAMPCCCYAADAMLIWRLCHMRYYADASMLTPLMSPLLMLCFRHALADAAADILRHADDAALISPTPLYCQPRRDFHYCRR